MDTADAGCALSVTDADSPAIKKRLQNGQTNVPPGEILPARPDGNPSCYAVTPDAGKHFHFHFFCDIHGVRFQNVHKGPDIQQTHAVRTVGGAGGRREAKTENTAQHTGKNDAHDTLRCQNPDGRPGLLFPGLLPAAPPVFLVTESVFLEAQGQHPLGQAELLRGPVDLPARCFHGVHDAGAFEFIHALLERGSHMRHLPLLFVGHVHAFRVHGRRQVLRQDEILGAHKEDGPFHGVLEFPDIAGPAVTLEHIHGSQGNTHVPLPRLPGEMPDKVAGQGQDVILAVPQRRKDDGKDIKPVKEITPERTLGHHLLEIAVGGRNHAYIHAYGLHTPETLERALLKNAEELGLGHHGKLAYLIEEYAGALPTWMAPEQVRFLPVTDRAADYCAEQAKKLEDMGFRVEVDYRNEKIGRKIRDAQMEKVPYMVVVGDRDMENGTVSPRHRADGDLGAMSMDEFSALLKQVVDNKEKK